ncbi:MAG: ABC transporter permease [Salinivirgaceae bacterium]|nr:ABC transporter permease [Salinivirgaceae bacterium]MDY0280248.1 ABC transporter permease [Salinivirgaceae bacterium]
MRTLRFLLKKEFLQIFRNKTVLKLIIALPLMQLLILPLAADFEIKNINIAIVDNDLSPMSQQLTSTIAASGYFKIIDSGNSYKIAFQQIENDKADLILQIPQNFEREMVREQSGNLFIAVNAINGAKANVGSVYLNRIIMEFNANIRTKLVGNTQNATLQSMEITSQFRFNKYLNYRLFMVPGILVMLVTLVGTYMCALNLVREKEIGTIEQINVTPIRKHHFILGKLIPFWIIGVFVFSVGLFIVAYPVYGVIVRGSIAVLYSYLSIYLVAVLGIGLLISTYSTNQQQAMSLAFFFLMIFFLMSGLFTPIDGMPDWAKWITRFNPVTYFIDVMRMVVMKGSGFVDLKVHFLVTIGFALFFNTWAIWNYRKTS